MPAPESIDCGLCRLRRWRLTDKPSLVRHANNRNIWRNLRDLFPFPYTEANADWWLGTMTSPEPPAWHYAIEVDGEAAGGIALRRGFDINRFTMEIGYWLGEACWGRGIMTAAVRELTQRGLEESDIYRIEAEVFSWNPASMRVLEKAGYRRETICERSAVKDGTLIDQVLYAITRDPGLPYVPA
jgi:[ribosomal protein S5]-alanine N-acetyltransferase